MPENLRFRIFHHEDECWKMIFPTCHLGCLFPFSPEFENVRVCLSLTTTHRITKPRWWNGYVHQGILASNRGQRGHITWASCYLPMQYLTEKSIGRTEATSVQRTWHNQDGQYGWLRPCLHCGTWSRHLRASTTTSKWQRIPESRKVLQKQFHWGLTFVI